MPVFLTTCPDSMEPGQGQTTSLHCDVMPLDQDQSTTFRPNVPVCIPARWDSTRLPGKLLATLANGKTVLQTTVETALRADCGPVFVLAADERIEVAARHFGVEVFRSIDPARNGSERIAEALRRGWLGIPTPPRVINLQGDAVGASAALLRAALNALDNCPGAELGTVAIPANSVQASGRTTVERDGLLGTNFSRKPLNNEEGLLLHVGIYAYNTASLLEVAMLPPSPREVEESLEQLRWVENGRGVGLTVAQASPAEAHAIDVLNDLQAQASA